MGTGAEDVGLIYMNARWYVPGIGRFASADTLVPDPANPQKFNRYTYVLNSPVNRIDPTGHWDCVQDANYDDCVASIEAWLSFLYNGGDIARGIYLWFLEEDIYWIIRNGTGILFEFKNLDYGAQVPFCGGATGLCGLVRGGPKININLGKLGETTGDPGKWNASLLAHEIVHLDQGDWFAASILGEAGAYYSQARVLNDLGVSPTGAAGKMWDYLDLGDFTFDHTELGGFAQSLGYPWYVPLTPVFTEKSLALVTDFTPFVSVDAFKGRAQAWQTTLNNVKPAPQFPSGFEPY